MATQGKETPMIKTMTMMHNIQRDDEVDNDNDTQYRDNSDTQESRASRQQQTTPHTYEKESITTTQGRPRR
jgi:hypothetical protein